MSQNTTLSVYVYAAYYIVAAAEYQAKEHSYRDTVVQSTSEEAMQISHSILH